MTTHTRPLDELVTVSQAARRLQVSAPTVRLWLKSGRLPSIRTPYGRLIEPQAVEGVAEERARAAGMPREISGRRDHTHL